MSCGRDEGRSLGLGVGLSTAQNAGICIGISVPLVFPQRCNYLKVNPDSAPRMSIKVFDTLAAGFAKLSAHAVTSSLSLVSSTSTKEAEVFDHALYR